MGQKETSPEKEESFEVRADRLARGMNHARIGLWDWNVQTGELVWTDNIWKLFGLAKETTDTTYDNFINAVHPDDRKLVSDAVNAALETGRDYQVEHRVVWPNGHVKWLKEQGGVEFDASGTPVRMLGAVQDISALKAVEQEAQYSRTMLERQTRQLAQYAKQYQAGKKEAETIFESVFDSAMVGLLIVNETGTVTKINDFAARMFGGEVSRITGLDIASLFPGTIDNEASSVAPFLQASSGTSSSEQTREVEGQKLNGDRFPVHLGVSTISLDGVAHYVASILDLTNAKKMEDELRRTNRIQAISHLTAGVAHDFNNLLGIILGNLDLIKRRVESESKIFRQLEKAISAAERGTGLTNKMLDFARQEPAAKETIELNNALQDFEEFTLRTLFKSGGVSVSLAPHPIYFVADKGDLSDALINLSVNARDAMPSGGRLEIDLKAVTLDRRLTDYKVDIEPGDYAVLRFADTGAGIAKEYLDSVFEPYFTTKERGKGTGLGLAMIYSFMRRCGGTIDVSSEVGKGTTFTLYFPIKQTLNALNEPQSETNEEASARKPKGNGEIILLVDDEEYLLDFASEALTDFGYQVLQARNGDEALEILKSNQKVDLLFTDVVMPGSINGVDLANLARELRPNIPVQLTSGYAGDQYRQANDRQLFDEMLAKPYTIDALAKAVARFFS